MSFVILYLYVYSILGAIQCRYVDGKYHRVASPPMFLWKSLFLSHLFIDKRAMIREYHGT